jgi:hypothetical protein
MLGREQHSLMNHCSISHVLIFQLMRGGELDSKMSCVPTNETIDKIIRDYNKRRRLYIYWHTALTMAVEGWCSNWTSKSKKYEQRLRRALIRAPVYYFLQYRNAIVWPLSHLPPLFPDPGLLSNLRRLGSSLYLRIRWDENCKITIRPLFQNSVSGFAGSAGRVLARWSHCLFEGMSDLWYVTRSFSYASI